MQSLTVVLRSIYNSFICDNSLLAVRFDYLKRNENPDSTYKNEKVSQGDRDVDR